MLVCIWTGGSIQVQFNWATKVLSQNILKVLRVNLTRATLLQPKIDHSGSVFFIWFFFLALLSILEKRKTDSGQNGISCCFLVTKWCVCLSDCWLTAVKHIYSVSMSTEQLVWHGLFQMADSWVALCSYTPLRVHHSRNWQHSLHVSLSAVTLSYFALFISISIFSFYLWTPLYLNYFREKVVLQPPRQSPIRSEGQFNISKAICKLQNTIKLDWNGSFKLWWTCGSESVDRMVAQWSVVVLKNSSALSIFSN